ncbi:MAG: hypothetical protein ACO3DT_17960, partial [Gammaproteobacteria bacterium]
HQCQTADSLDELAHNVFDCLREFELDSSLLILDEPENRVWFSDDINRPMESQILGSLRGQDRVVSFGTRLALSTDHATILVRNLTTTRERVDRVREHLSILIEALDRRIHAMQSQQLLDERRDLLSRVLQATRDNLGQLEELHQRQKSRAAEILEAMGKSLDKSMQRLELTEKQQAALTRIIATTAEQCESMHDDGLEIDEQFREIIEELSGALEK